MYKQINIAGEEFKLEYKFEASLHSECVESVIKLMGGLSTGDGSSVANIAHHIGNLPITAMHVFYAGLLEHHGQEGDRRVTTLKDAKILMVKYFKEHADDESGNFYGLLDICMDQMGEDGFFKLIGLESLTQSEQKPAKAPQDHKKPVKKASEK